VFVYVFFDGAVIALIVLRVKKNIIVRSNVIVSVAAIVALRLIVGVSIAIIVVIIIRRLLRVCALVSLFSLAKEVFASFAF
jgi:hypothetical protein